MKYTYSVIYALLLFVSSCSSDLEEVIESSNLESIVESLKSEDAELDSMKISFLDNLVVLNKGREAYMDELKSTLPNLKIDMNEVVLPEKDYNRRKEQLFNYFKRKEITYGKILAEFDTIKAISANYDNQAQDVLKDIDAFCISAQSKIDKDRETKQDALNQMNESISISIIGLNEKIVDYRKVVEVVFSYEQSEGKTVKALGFNIDVLSEEEAWLSTLQVNTTVRSNDKTFSYLVDKVNSPREFFTLNSLDLESIKSDVELFKVEYPSETISALSDDEELLAVNYDYSSPEELTGTCPYLSRDNELKLKLRELKVEKTQVIQTKTSLISKYQKMTSQFVDFSRRFKKE